jgi:TM2 domain-containing membrane protein YozV
MKCAAHPEVDAAGFCRNCGKALCAECTRDVRGIYYCEGCLAALVGKPQAVPGAGNPALAAILGFVPGLGAVYNGEYMKAVIQVLIFAGLVTMASRGGPQPLLGLLIAALVVYMPIDAYRTAKAKALGQPAPVGEFGRNQPITAFLLIALGVIFLLHNFRVFFLRRLLEFWPVVLIVLGVLMLLRRTGRQTLGGGGQ